MEEEKVQAAAPQKPCSCASDLRIFVIALLTALIVVSLYHLGTGYRRMKAALERRNTAPKTQTVCPCCARMGMPQPGMRMGMPKPGFEGGRRFEGAPGRRHFRPGDKPMMKRGPRPADAPKPAPAPEAPEAPKTPAPAPAK